MYCRAHNFSNINPPKAYAIIHRCNCPVIPAVYPHPSATIFDSFNTTTSGQHFSLPTPLISYTILKMTAIQLSKLMKTCKLLKFYVHRFRGFVLSSLSLQYGYATGFNIEDMSLNVTSDNINFTKLFTGLKLSGESFTLFQHRSEVTVASLVLSNVKSFKFRYIEISNQILSLKELDILLGPHVQVFKTQGLAFKDLPLNEGSVEKIMEKLPNAECLVLKNLNFGPLTAQTLAKLQQRIRLKYFELTRVPAYFNRQHFCEFVKKSISSKAALIIRFDIEVSKKCRSKFRETLKKAIKKEFEEEHRPVLSVACAEYIS